MVIKFSVPGEPKGKGRPRLGRSGHAYTPHDTANYENLVKVCFAEAFPDFVPLTDEVWVDIVAYYKIPKSVSKKKSIDMALGFVPPLKKPDLDNIAKIICDSLNGMAYADDSQITKLIVRKQYGNTPRVDVKLGWKSDGEQH